MMLLDVRFVCLYFLFISFAEKKRTKETARQSALSCVFLVQWGETFSLIPLNDKFAGASWNGCLKSRFWIPRWQTAEPNVRNRKRTVEPWPILDMWVRGFRLVPGRFSWFVLCTRKE